MFPTWFTSLKNGPKINEQIVQKPAVINPNYFNSDINETKGFIPFEDNRKKSYVQIIRQPIINPKPEPVRHYSPPKIKAPIAILPKSPKPKKFEIKYEENKCKAKNANKKDEAGMQGRCMNMCSLAEIEARQSINDWSIFELDTAKYRASRSKNGEPQIINPKFAIKKYERSAADRKVDDADNIRPPSVLLQTINYLITEILDYEKKGPKYSNYKYVEDPRYNVIQEIYLFFSDRSRAIRQDFIVLNNHSERNCIQTFERIARFHLLASNEFAELEQFNDMQNSQQLTATLTSLREFYQHSRKNLFLSKDAYKSTNEAEFYSYSLLWNINDKVKLEEIMVSLPKDILTSVEV